VGRRQAGRARPARAGVRRARPRAAARAAALAHRAHPAIPSLDVTTYKPGDYTDLADALAHPDDVVELAGA
jgi:hypothetical protein